MTKYEKAIEILETIQRKQKRFSQDVEMSGFYKNAEKGQILKIQNMSIEEAEELYV